MRGSSRSCFPLLLQHERVGYNGFGISRRAARQTLMTGHERGIAGKGRHNGILLL
jgi:hypothetical protein